MGASCFGSKTKRVIIIETADNKERSNIVERVKKLGDLESHLFEKELERIRDESRDTKKHPGMNYLDINDDNPEHSKSFKE